MSDDKKTDDLSKELFEEIKKDLLNVGLEFENVFFKHRARLGEQGLLNRDSFMQESIAYEYFLNSIICLYLKTYISDDKYKEQMDEIIDYAIKLTTKVRDGQQKS